MSDVCSSCPHAVVDHLDTGCMTCSCLNVFYPADPEPAPDESTVVPQNDEETGTVVPETEADPEPESPDADPAE
jgi:hypothetical protein